MDEKRIERLEAELFVNEALVDAVISIVGVMSGHKKVVKEGLAETLQSIIDVSQKDTLREAARRRLERLQKADDEPAD